jgi:hypothetical protein
MLHPLLPLPQQQVEQAALTPSCLPAAAAAIITTTTIIITTTIHTLLSQTAAAMAAQGRCRKRL